jgi:phenylacetate-coenzyme A ligase PaaK-like adenylate-forming protein
MGNPVYLHWLARMAAEHSIDLPRPEVVVVAYQFLCQFQRRALERYFNAPVYGFYGATDVAGVLGQECPNGRMHSYTSHHVVEVVDESGMPQAEGQLGAYAWTTLPIRAMPLIRYVNGDVGKILGTPDCGCALEGSPEIEVHGRAADCLFLDGNWITTRMFDDAISKVAGVDFYEVTQTGASEVVVQAIASPGCSIIGEEIIDCTRAAFEVRSVIVKPVQHLEATAGSGKFATTRQNWSGAPLPPWILLSEK